MSIEALEGVTDQDLFNDANSDEAPETNEVPVAEAAPAPIEQPRDDAGRFAGKPADEPAAAAATDPLARAPVDDNAPQVPSWRVREINDEKRVLADRVAALETEKSQWQRPQQQAPAPTPVAQPKVEKPDPLLDPEGYEKYLENKFEEKLLNNHRENSLQLAARTYKEEFAEAYAAAQKGVDPTLRVRMQQSNDPGETLIQWHREQKTRAEVGTDPNAYFDKRLDAFLTDPANQAKVMERIRGSVQPQGGGKPSPVSLPPSLTRATNASSDISADDNDVSDDGLWRHANA